LAISYCDGDPGHTASIYISLAHSRSVPSDLNYILLGASVPFILRREENHYRVVGEAYVKGLMFGEAIQMKRRGDLEVQTIDLH